MCERCVVKEKLIAVFGSIGGTIYNLSYVAMAIMPIWVLPIRWWWKIALFAGIYFIPILGGLILYALEFVAIAIVLRETQNLFAIIYYIQFGLFLIFVFIPFLMAVFSSIVHRPQK